MLKRWPILAYVLLTAFSMALFGIGGEIASIQLGEAQRARQLDELSRVSLRRAEAAVDYGSSALADLAEIGPLGCDAVSLQVIRFHVYQRGAVKDIRLANHDGSVRCSAYSDTLEFDKSWVGRDQMLQTPDMAVQLFRVEQLFGVALGVLRDQTATDSLVAILSISGAQLDVMPESLRGHSEVRIELTDGQTISAIGPPVSIDRSEPPVTVAAVSDRYPVQVIIEVERAAYAGWNNEATLPIVLLATALGLAFGLLGARAMSRPASPVADLDRAIAAREFKPYLQTTVDLATGEFTGAEMLARWVKADGTVVSPARFIKLAEDSGRIAEITWQMLTAALGSLREELKRDKYFKLSVNIAPSHFMAPGFVADLRRVVSTARVAQRQIVVELTEREAYDDLERAAAIVAELRGYGFRVAIDDVGIGNSGLLQLQRLGADVLKIDKLFVDAINRDPTARSVVEMLVRLADRLGMSTVAEGIEEEVQVDALRECGVPTGQGYFFALPLPLPVFLEKLSARRQPADSQPPASAVSAA